MTLPSASIWQTVRLELEKSVASGDWEESERLPSEAALADRFGVHRHTVRRALSALAMDGLVRIEKGKGAFVESEALEYRIGRRTRFSENMKRLGMEQHAQLLGDEVQRAGAPIAQALNIRAGQQVTVLTTLRHVQGRPISLASHHFPRDRFGNIKEAFLKTGSITLALRELGIAEYFRRSSTITAMLPDEDDARWLGQPRTQPILVIESVNVSPEESPILFSRTRMSALRVQLTFDVIADI